MEEQITILQQIDLFCSFDLPELESLAATISEISVESGAVIYEEGTPGEDMYILMEGALRISKGNRTITQLNPIDYIGEMAIIETKPRSATVVAVTPSRLLRITAAQFEKFLARQPKSLVSMIKTMSRRIRDDTKLIAQEYEKANILIHDMRNTVAAFLLLDIVEKEKAPDKRKHYIELMQKGRRDLAEMMDEALANAKKLQYIKQIKNNSLPDLVTDLEAAISVHPDLTDKVMSSEIDNHLPDFPFYRTDIRRVITNLLVNAGQASKADGEIKIKLYREAEQAVFEVSDQGSGIPSHIKSKIFLPYFTTKKNGNGFGLASCKQIIEKKHHGLLAFKSTEGKGSTFKFSLPISAAPEM